MTKHLDYGGAACAIILGQTFHWFGIRLNVTHTLVHDLLTAINTAALAFSGVVATEVAKLAINKIKQLLTKNKKQNERNN